MLTILTAIQLLCSLFLVLEIIYVVKQSPSYEQILMLAILVCTLYITVAYTMEMYAHTADSAILLAQLAYFANPFLSVCLLLFTARYCRVNWPSALQTGLVLVQVGFAVIVLTNNLHHLYYRTVEFVPGNLFSYVSKTHGPFYILYMIVISLHSLTAIILCLRRRRFVTDPNVRRQLWILIAITLLPIAGFFINFVDVADGYDTTILCTSLSCIVLLFSFFRHDLFGTLALAKEQVLDDIPDSVVILGTQNELLFANLTARTLLKTYGYPENPPPELLNQWAASTRKFYTREGHAYQTMRHAIRRNGMLRGTIYIISDITERYQYTQRLEQTVREKTHEIREVQHEVIMSVASMIEARDVTTGAHLKHTSRLVELTLQALRARGCYPDQLTDEYCADMVYAAPLHDIGKIAIPDQILRKPGPLTESEMRVMRTHTQIGADIIDRIQDNVQQSSYLRVAHEIALSHHENWIGGGYPNNMRGYEIPLSARIISVVDVYDALVSERCYKEAFSQEEAFRLIESEAGKKFDPQIAEAFLSIRADIIRLSLENA